MVNAPSGSSAFMHAVLQPLKTLCTERFDGQLVLLVDALDEAAQYKGEETIVDLLANAGALPRQMRFVLTSRPDGAVLRHFEDRQIPHFRLDAGQPENLKDIRRYVQMQLAASEAMRSRLLEKRMSSEVFVDRVTTASQGNFLYVIWLLQAIAAGTQSFDTLDALPQGLDSIYREFLRTRKTRNEEKWQRVYEPILGVLAVAQAPLNRELVSQYTGLTTQEVRYGIQDLRQFLEPASADEGSYFLYHQSIMDWLKDEGRSQEFWVDVVPAHQRIVEHYRGAAPSWDDVDWRQVDDYGLKHIVRHLYSLRNESSYRSQLYELIDRSLLSARISRYGDFTSFLQDVEIVLNAATMEQPPNLFQIVRHCMFYGMLIESAPPQIVYVLASLGQFVRARLIANNIIFAVDRALAYALLSKAYAKKRDIMEAKKCIQDAKRALVSIEDSNKAMGFYWLVEAEHAIDENEYAEQIAIQALNFALNFMQKTDGWDDPNVLFWTAKSLKQTKNEKGLERIKQELHARKHSAIRNQFLQAMGVARDIQGLRNAFEQLTDSSSLKDPMSVRNLSNLALALEDAEMMHERDEVFSLICQLLSKGKSIGPSDSQRRYVWSLALAGQFDQALSYLEHIPVVEEKAKGLSMIAEIAASRQLDSVVKRTITIGKTLITSDDWRVLSHLAQLFLLGEETLQAKTIAERICRMNVIPSIQNTLAMPYNPYQGGSGKTGKRPLLTEIHSLEDEKLLEDIMDLVAKGQLVAANAKVDTIQIPTIRERALLCIAQYEMDPNKKLSLWIEALMAARFSGRGSVNNVMIAGKELGLKQVDSSFCKEIEKMVADLDEWTQ